MFFAIMNFTLSGALGVIGLLTLRRVSEPKEVVFASLPLLFALHQFTQGFVWLGMDGLIEPRALEMAESIFIFYAQGLLPFLVPLAIWLLEPSGWYRRVIGVLLVLGGILAAYTLWGLSVQPTYVAVKHDALVYVNAWTQKGWINIAYILTTCGPLVLSSSVSVQLFGWFNLMGLVGITLWKPYAVTSVWCLYAAVVSIMLYFYFVERRIAFLQEIRRKETEWSGALMQELSHLERHFPRVRRVLLHYRNL
ncbi:hypothetical protein LOH54_01630 [Sulfurimonas sp. HSL-3221]|uniref:DUF6629 family protein n=1 Tax=Sulfurimonadaceae TaxID=2771471 RepID=UPI001E2C8951|nr:DUF6629 family protein [Sulfurimonas sp. HSL-3221]UFS62842.1 hypothetical protein LOH54_01630 [Sulfurimonas sp. HSL-3221]